MSAPALIVQAEPWEEEKPSYIELSGELLGRLSEAYAWLLGEAGVSRGDKLLAYDFSMSLPVLLLSRAYAPGLERGACEILGCSVLSVDGVPELAARSAFMFSMLRPTVLLIRSDLVSVFRSKLEKGDLSKADPELKLVLVVHPDPAPLPREVRLGPGRFSRLLMYKSDKALFLGLVREGKLVYKKDAYRVSCSSGHVEIEALLAGRPRHRTSLECGDGKVEEAEMI